MSNQEKIIPESCLSTSPDGTVLIRVYVQPKASRSRLVGLHDGCLKLAVAAPPVDGKANKQVVKYLAGILDVPVREVTVKSGLQSRRKLVALNVPDVNEIRSMLEKLLLSIDGE
ncbi:MAG: DUF167 domain-containing protein [Desulforhopalus sp.]